MREIERCVGAGAACLRACFTLGAAQCAFSAKMMPVAAVQSFDVKGEFHRPNFAQGANLDVTKRGIRSSSANGSDCDGCLHGTGK